MNKQNVKEYELMRAELLNIKSCITTYMGYMLSGAGVALVGMAAMSKTNNSWFSVYASASVTIILLLVLMIIYYKFNSHNRGAAYCKVLSHESCLIQEEQENVISWELCIQQLRDSDANQSIFINRVEGCEIEGLNKNKFIQCLKQITGLNPPIDRDRTKRGVKLLIGSLISHPAGRVSWGFPISVSSVFLVLTSIFALVFLWHFSQLISDPGTVGTDRFVLLITLLMFIVFTGYMWARLAGKLYSLVYGSATIRGYYIRFLASRANILSSKGIKPKYDIDELDLENNCLE